MITWKNELGQYISDFGQYTSPAGITYPVGFPKSQIPGLDYVYPEVVYPPTPEEVAANLAQAKVAMNAQINAWRAKANLTSFTHLGKQIACDDLSRSDIDAVAGEISLNGAFPSGFPGAWKAMDNSYILLPNLAAFKSMYSSMTLQGTINFGRSQTLKAALAAATTVAQVNALTWE